MSRPNKPLTAAWILMCLAYVMALTVAILHIKTPAYWEALAPWALLAAAVLIVLGWAIRQSEK